MFKLYCDIMDIILSHYLKRVCKRLKEGDFSCPQRPIFPNPYIDFLVFAKYLKTLSKSDRTVKEYLYKIKDFHTEIHPDNIRNFRKHIYFKTEYVYGVRKGQPYMPSDSARKRKTYMVYNALNHYLLAIDQRVWRHYLPPKSEINNPIKIVKEVDITEEEIQQTINAAENEYKLLFTLLRYTGMRISETLLLKKNWINFETDPIEITIPINISKSKKPGKVYILKKHAKDLIQVCNKIRSNNYILILMPELYKQINKKNKSRIKVKTFDYVEKEQLKVLFKMRELAPQRVKNTITPHWFRHHFAQIFFNKGYDLKQIQNLLRHASIETTGGYIRVSEKQTKKTYAEGIE